MTFRRLRRAEKSGGGEKRRGDLARSPAINWGSNRAVAEHPRRVRPCARERRPPATGSRDASTQCGAGEARRLAEEAPVHT